MFFSFEAYAQTLPKSWTRKDLIFFSYIDTDSPFHSFHSVWLTVFFLVIFIGIQLMDEDPVADDLLGTKTFELSDLHIGTKVNKTFKFGNDQVL